MQEHTRGNFNIKLNFTTAHGITNFLAATHQNSSMAAEGHWLFCGVAIIAMTSSTAHRCIITAMTANETSVECGGQGYDTIPCDLPRNMTTLDFANNQLTALTNNMFGNYSNLRELFLWGNPIESYTARAFAGLTRLEYLDLSLTMLTSINTSLCRDLQSLKKFRSERGWKLTSLGDDAFKGCNELSTVVIYNIDKLKTINKAFANLPGLTTLHLDNNLYLQVTDPLAFENSPLVELRMTTVRLPHLPTAIRNIPSLRNLSISNAGLQSFSRKDTAFFDKLQVLDASYNPYKCACDTAHFITWFQHTHVIANKANYFCENVGFCLLKDYNLKPCMTLQHKCFPCYVATIVAVVVLSEAVVVTIAIILLYIRRRRRYSGYSRIPASRR